MANGKGRDKRLEIRWRRIIKEHVNSGLTIRDFCRKSKLPESAFYFWRRELERRGLARREAEQEQRERPTRPAFLPVRVAHEPGPGERGGVEIALPGGVQVHVTAPVDRQALADVLLAVSDVERAVLEGRPC
jgi:hypothetical protein